MWWSLLWIITLRKAKCFWLGWGPLPCCILQSAVHVNFKKECGYLNMTLIPLINNSPWIPSFPLMLPFRILLILSLSRWVRTTALQSSSCHNRNIYRLQLALLYILLLNYKKVSLCWLTSGFYVVNWWKTEIVSAFCTENGCEALWWLCPYEVNYPLWLSNSDSFFCFDCFD